MFTCVKIKKYHHRVFLHTKTKNKQGNKRIFLNNITQLLFFWL